MHVTISADLVRLTRIRIESLTFRWWSCVWNYEYLVHTLKSSYVLLFCLFKLFNELLFLNMINVSLVHIFSVGGPDEILLLRKPNLNRILWSLVFEFLIVSREWKTLPSQHDSVVVGVIEISPCLWRIGRALAPYSLIKTKSAVAFRQTVQCSVWRVYIPSLSLGNR